MSREDGMDARLAYVEITMALAAIHGAFCANLPNVSVPPTPKKSKNKKAAGTVKEATADPAAQVSDKPAAKNKKRVLTPFERRMACYEATKKQVEKLASKSIELTACEEPESVIQSINAYDDWLTGLIEYENHGDMAYEAARAVVKPLRELRSIYRVARPYPDSASRRARSIAERAASL